MKNFRGYKAYEKVQNDFKAVGKGNAVKRAEVYSVISLVHGAGCTHMALAMANYLAQLKRFETIALISREFDSDFIKGHMAENVVALMNGDKETEKYAFKVYDVGVVDLRMDPTEDLPDRTSDSVGQRFVLCNDNEDYYYNLDKLTRNAARSKDFVYLFNRIPRESYSKVEAVMQGYLFNFVPLFRIDNVKDIKGLLELYI